VLVTGVVVVVVWVEVKVKVTGIVTPIVLVVKLVLVALAVEVDVKVTPGTVVADSCVKVDRPDTTSVDESMMVDVLAVPSSFSTAFVLSAPSILQPNEYEVPLLRLQL
jgi:hypothetical protein